LNFVGSPMCQSSFRYLIIVLATTTLQEQQQ
jgi:hypothetical protein